MTTELLFFAQKLTSLPPWVDIGCKTALTQLICNTYMPPAVVVQLVSSVMGAGAVPLIRRPCRNVCNTALTKCSRFFAVVVQQQLQQQQLVPNCSAVSSGVDMYPAGECFINGSIVHIASNTQCKGTWRHGNAIAWPPPTQSPSIAAAVAANINYNTTQPPNTLYNTKITIPVVVSQCVMLSELEQFNGRSERLQSAEFAPKCPSPLRATTMPTTSATTTPTAAYIESICTLPCPSPLFTSSEWHAANVQLVSSAAVGACSSLYIVLTWLLDAHKRSSQRVILYAAVSSLMVSVGVLMGSFNGTEQTWCNHQYSHNNDMPKSSHDYNGFVCLAQASIIVYFGIALTVWWMCFAVLTQGTVIWRIDHETRARWIRRFHVLGWIVPVVPVVVLLQQQQLGYDNVTAPYCFIIGTAWQLLMFYLPMVICMSVGSLYMYRIVAHIWHTVKAAQVIQSPHVAALRQAVKRPVLFLLSFWCVFAVLVWYRAYTLFYQSDYEYSAGQWIMCLLSSSSNKNSSNSGNISNISSSSCGVAPSVRPSLIRWHLFVMCVGGQGLFVFITFAGWKYIGQWMLVFRVAVDWCKWTMLFKCWCLWSCCDSSRRRKGDCVAARRTMSGVCVEMTDLGEQNKDR